MPPYRATVHRRLRDELSGVQLLTICTHDPTDNHRWPDVSQEDVPHLSFAQPGDGPLGNWQHAHDEWTKAGRIIRWLARVRPSMVSINGYNDLGRLRVLAWCKANGVPALLQGDSNIRSDRQRGLKALVKRWYVGTVVRLFDGFLPFGSLGQAYFRKYGACHNRIFYAPLEPDYDQLMRVPAAAARRAATRFGLQAGRRRLVYSGRLAPEKRVDLVIEAFARLATERPDWDLVIMGDGPLRDALRAKVPAELSGRVIWTGGLRSPADVFAVYKVCDVLMLPSDHEPWALVVNEAAAAGLAIVCSDAVGAAPELVQDGVNGRSFPRGDLNAFVAALREVTAVDQIDRMKAGSAAVLDAWRKSGDPVAGYLAAMRRFGVHVPAKTPAAKSTAAALPAGSSRATPPRQLAVEEPAACCSW